MFKIMNNKAPNYLLNMIPKSQQTFTNRNNHIPNYYCRTDCFKYSFFSSTLKDWFNLYASIRKSESLAMFKSRLLFFIRPIQSKSVSVNFSLLLIVLKEIYFYMVTHLLTQIKIS